MEQMRRWSGWVLFSLMLVMVGCGGDETPSDGPEQSNNGEQNNEMVDMGGEDEPDMEEEPECQPDERRCVNTDVEVCAQGAWALLGPCPTGTICDFGQCVPECTPVCIGRECGEDGCGGSCGGCEPGRACTEDGLCAPVGPSCGDGICQGTEDCGDCPADCGQCCGDGTCGQDENCATCLVDCGCPQGQICDAQSQACECSPNCAGRVCGDDGCGGTCGDCAQGSLCNGDSGQCEVQCVPSCDGRACGDDGCGGSCGSCSEDQLCNGAGQCVEPPAECGDGVCEEGSEDCATCPADCGQCCGDGVCSQGQGESCATCLADCGCPEGESCSPTGRVCECARQCNGRQCGDDGCGGTCGTCEEGSLCNDDLGRCEEQCVPSCQGRSCGPDGCGGSCGACTGDLLCNEQGQCVAPPAECGDNVCDEGAETCLTCPADCGQCCGDGACVGEHSEDCSTCPADCGCPEGEACSQNTLACECVPQCNGRQCGPDGCGGQCGVCSGNQSCNENSGQCEVQCVPACQGRACGDDGCGGQCGQCGQGQICREDGVCIREPVACNCEPGQICLDEICRDAELTCSPANQVGLCENGQTCIEGECVATGASCSQDNPAGVCPVGQVCRGGSCRSLDDEALCDDGNACTADRFDPLRNRCVYTPQQVVCSDGNACTQDSCQAGVCVGERIDGCVEPPEIGPYTTPTNVGQVQLTGTKPAGALVEINSQTAVPESPDQEWSVTLNLQPGQNRYVIRSVDNGMPSAEVEVVIVFDIQAPLTTMTPQGGVFLNGVTVTAAANESATIYYTTDGSTPTVHSPSFASVKQFRIFDTSTLRLRALDRAGNWEEEVVTGNFEITAADNYWRSGTSLPEALTLMGVAEISGDLFVVGGTDGMSPQAGAYRYDVSEDAWMTLPSMPRGRAQVSLVSAGSSLYAFGGEDEGTPLNEVLRLDTVNSDAWATMAPMPSTRFGTAAVLWNNKAYVLGGQANGGAVLNNLEVYDIANNTWTNEVAQMPRARYAFGAVAHEGRIYVFGGEDAEGDLIEELDIYDVANNTWSQGAPLPTPRSFLGGFLMTNPGEVPGGYVGVVAVGGRGLGGEPLARVEEYIIEDGVWRERSPLPRPRQGAGSVSVEVADDTDNVTRHGWMVGGQVEDALVTSMVRYFEPQDYARRMDDMPSPRFLHNAVALDSRIYVLGGRGFQKDRSVWSFDPETQTFVSLAQLPSFQNNAGAVALGDRVYVFGGSNNFGNPVATARAYDPATNTWQELRSMPTARSAPAVAVQGHLIYVIGGFNGTALQSVEIYNTRDNTWATGATLPEGRSGGFATNYEGRLYLLGGYNPQGNVSGTVYRFAEGRWAEYAVGYAVADAPAAQVYNGQVVFFGGRTQAGITQDIKRYNLATRQIVNISQSLVASRDKLMASVLNGEVYLLGGNDTAESVAPGLSLVQKIKGTCFNGIRDGRETEPDLGGGCDRFAFSYEASFNQGNLSSNSSQCRDWNSFRNQLQGEFSFIRVYGNRSPQGVTCTGAPARTLCNALRTNTNSTPDVVVTCNGLRWSVGNCGAGVGISVDPSDGDACSCGTDYTVRPCINNNNWGGINTTACGAISQTMAVECR